MNVNVRLSEAALFLLLTFSATFATGFQAGKSYAEQGVRQPANSGVVNTR
jgi:hypothetical protein